MINTHTNDSPVLICWPSLWHSTSALQQRALHATHQLFDGVRNDLVPVSDDAVSVILNEVLRPVTSLHLSRAQEVNTMSQLQFSLI